jgi:hypothetical protein
MTYTIIVIHCLLFVFFVFFTLYVIQYLEILYRHFYYFCVLNFVLSGLWCQVSSAHVIVFVFLECVLSVLFLIPMFVILMLVSVLSNKFKDTKGLITSRKSKDRQYNNQQKKDKQWSTKPLYRRTDNTMTNRKKTSNDLLNHYTDNWLSNTNPTQTEV